MIPRTLFAEEHEIFRDSVRKFVEQELLPNNERWEEQGRVDRDAWLKAGAAGMLCCDVPEAYGGLGVDFLFNVVVIEELARAGLTGPGFVNHSDMVTPYIVSLGSEEIKRKWLPQMVAGEKIGAIAMTEPGAGSDLAAIKTFARRDGDDYVISGQKVYISNGQNCDILVLATKTDREAGAKGVTLFAVEADRPGFRKGQQLRKIGMKSQDTSELFFDEVRVPAANRLGEEGAGFKVLMGKLARERLTQAIRSATAAEAYIEWTVAYTQERHAFGKAIGDFQNTRFKLAELQTLAMAGRALVDRCIALFLEDRLDAVDSATAKLYATDLHFKVADECLQFFGGYGYMAEYPIARAFVDSRVNRITGGAAEIMKQIIAQRMFGGKAK